MEDFGLQLLLLKLTTTPSESPSIEDVIMLTEEYIKNPFKPPTPAEERIVFELMISALEGKRLEKLLSIVGRCGYLLRSPEKLDPLFPFDNDGISIITGLPSPKDCKHDPSSPQVSHQDETTGALSDANMTLWHALLDKGNTFTLLEELKGILTDKEEPIKEDEIAKLNILSYLAGISLRTLARSHKTVANGFKQAIITYGKFYHIYFNANELGVSKLYYSSLVSMTINTPDIARLFCNMLIIYKISEERVVNDIRKPIFDFMCLCHTRGTGLQLYIMFCRCYELLRKPIEQCLAAFTSTVTENSVKLLTKMIVNYGSSSTPPIWQWAKVLRTVWFNEYAIKNHVYLALRLAGCISMIRRGIVDMAVFGRIDRRIKDNQIEVGKAIYLKANPHPSEEERLLMDPKLLKAYKSIPKSDATEIRCFE